MSSFTRQEVQCSLQMSATPNIAWTDNPAYLNKYEIAAQEQLSTYGERAALSLPMETCLSCSLKFVLEVAGQSFCSEECYVPPCSYCHHGLGSLAGDNSMTRGLHLCADCYWDAEEEWRYQRASARSKALDQDNTAESHDSSHAIADGGVKTPSSPSSFTFAVFEPDKVEFIFPGEPGYNRDWDDWSTEDEDEDELDTEGEEERMDRREERDYIQHQFFNNFIRTNFNKIALDKRIEQLKAQIAAKK